MEITTEVPTEDIFHEMKEDIRDLIFACIEAWMDANLEDVISDSNTNADWAEQVETLQGELDDLKYTVQDLMSQIENLEPTTGARSAQTIKVLDMITRALNESHGL